ncbi:hypothetical protein ACROYT_G010131 [Oculina patagonica]
MEKVEYKLIISLTTLLLAAGPFIVLFVIIVCKPKKYSGNSVESYYRRKGCITNKLPVFIKTKTDKDGETRSFRGIGITYDITSFAQSMCSFMYLFLLLFGGVTTLIFQFLLLDVSYNLRTHKDFRLLIHAADISHSCEKNEKSKECFEYEAWNKVNGDPIDCNSTAVQNGTIDVICYRTVFSIALASGASFSGFQVSLVVLNVATSVAILLTVLNLYLMVFPRIKGQLKEFT